MKTALPTLVALLMTIGCGACAVESRDAGINPNHYLELNAEWNRKRLDDQCGKIKVFVHLENACLDEVFDYLRFELHVNFTVDIAKARARSEGRRVTCDIPDATLRDALKQILQPLGLDYDYTYDGLTISTPEDLAADREEQAHPERGWNATQKALDEVISFDFRRADLKEVVQYLQEKHNLTIIVFESDVAGWQSIPITCKVNNMKMRDALVQLLHPHCLDCMPAGHRSVYVSTKENIAQHQPKAMYERALDRKASLDFHNASIEDVLAYLNRTHQIDIVLDRAAIGQQNKATVTCNLEGVKLRDALKRILEPRGLTYGLVKYVGKWSIYVGTPEGLLEYQAQKETK